MNLTCPNKTITCLLLALIFSQSKTLAQGITTIDEIASKHMYPFYQNNESFEGNGWDKIKTYAGEHKYFLIGEDHGLAEIALFTKALIQHTDYDLFVTEIDSISATISKQIGSLTDDQIVSFHTNNPSALSFYSAKEEFELMKELSKSNADIWGLDQVSLFSTGNVFRRLNEICNSEEAKELTAKLAKLSDQLFIEATRTANYDTLFIYSSKQEVFDELRETLQRENIGAKSLLNDLEESWKIYNGLAGANYNTRIRAMKSKLLNYYMDRSSKGMKYEKVLYKFGAYHVGKSESIFGLHDVGNFASNIAEAEGASSYHLMVVGKRGEMNSFLLAKGMESATFDISDKNSPLRGLLPLANLIDEKEWAFFDLKPLRISLRKGELIIDNAFLKNTINGYDGIVIIPETSASTSY
ncbi:TraB/GumN family protein [Ekhidna sp.]